MASSAPRSPVLKQPVKIACVQLAAGPDKAANLAHAAVKVREAAATGAKIVVLPECFNSPYGCDHFPTYAERLLPSPPPPEQSPSFHALSAMARDNGIYLIGGSIPELVVTTEDGSGASGQDTIEEEENKKKKKKKDEKTYYNTSLTFSPTGELLATYRKMHLFDISIPGKITFRESDVLSPGDSLALVDLPEYGRVAIAICYDVRFPELAMIAARRGCFALVYPGAFNLTTGPLHWQLLARARAVDNQVYVAMCSPARDMSAGYHAWGHSLVVDPMAQVLVEAGEGEEVVVADLDGEKIEEARKGIPLRDQRRFDVYADVSRVKP
ncbi:hypothetical protein MYCTH_2302496 [Thermothelomyces thermophilus ATCC 42464]|uniref:CN hydrolase domain-containing protein n=1 Tax=Thermothelomyces thermophilus (strain ATCC 42464 / BCRC 31852 / DSM 1799) TaxID=573729 RepID=G2Q7T4_THET4|nr:uncharacterized protein MYCTH_2302496 [Thermothelomyces thermophilus ATCC 42464]AEO56943.1 hypothetical protein MYCTH_2302496 [Thermothelomyces thermophilus ATCC 42464]